MSPAEAILETHSLTKIYPPRRKDVRTLKDIWDKITGKESGKPVTALKDFDLSVRHKEIFGLVGPNGAGKTTLCKILNALVLPTSGSASIDGHDVIKEHGKVCRTVFPLFGGETDMWGIFAGRLNVVKNLSFVARIWRVPPGEMEERMDHALKVLRIDDKKDEWFQKLSAGEKQKAWLACMMTVRPRLAILDEPTIKLDVGTRRQFYKVLKEELRDQFESTIFLTTHNLYEAETLCDRVGIINRGSLVATDSPANLKRYVAKEQAVSVLVRCGEEATLREAVRRLADMSNVSDARIEEPELDLTPKSARGCKRLNLRIDQEAQDLDLVLEVFARLGIRVVSLQTNEVSLEDAFLRLTEEGQEGKKDG